MGSKIDKGEREIEKGELMEFCEKKNMRGFETSAKENIGIDQAFETIIKMAAEYHEEDLEPMMPIDPNPVRPK